MTSRVNWALLGLVIERPGYGLELYNRSQRVYGDALAFGGESHIYAALDRLLIRALIEVVPGTDVGRQPRVHYRATAIGIRKYEDWLVAEMAEERRRQELWVRQLGVFSGDPAAALRVIDRFQEESLKSAGHSEPSTRNASPRGELIDRLVAEWRGLTEGGMVTWLQHAHEGFEALADEARADAAPRT